MATLLQHDLRSRIRVGVDRVRSVEWARPVATAVDRPRTVPAEGRSSRVASSVAVLVSVGALVTLLVGMAVLGREALELVSGFFTAT